jgi:diguanylate cyclase (GGDEF)-like protein
VTHAERLRVEALPSDPMATVADFAVTAPVVSPADSLAHVDGLFREDPTLRVVMVGTGEEAYVISRERLYRALTNHSDEGQSPSSCSIASAIAPLTTFVLDGRLLLPEAAEQIVGHDPECLYDYVLVQDGDSTKLLSVAVVYKNLAKLIRDVALNDPLTALANRVALDHRGPRLVDESSDPTSVAVLYIDLDGFKEINDEFGHRAGDEVLIAFAQRLRSATRVDDVVARLGGDEFAVLLTGVSEDEAMGIADRVLLSVTTPFLLAGEAVYLGASIGVAMGSDVVRESGITLLDSMIRLADDTMLQVKRSGKGRAERISVAASGSELMRRGVLRRRLAEALRSPDGVFSLHYQPMLNLRTGDSSAVEALLRWTDIELGEIPADEFIPIAEESDLINRIGDWVLNAACEQAVRWLQDGQARVVSVNVSPVQLRTANFVTAVRDALSRWGLPPRYLRLEITETAAVLDPKTTAGYLSQVRELGVEIELDDFGTGFSSLSLLRALPLATVKIDRTFIDRIDSEPADLAMIRGVVDSAHALGLRVTVEGVERREQLALLREVGADAAQGFFISRPTIAEQLPPVDAGDKVLDRA